LVARLLLLAVWISAVAQAGALPAPVRAALKEAGLPESSLGVWVQEERARKPLLALGAERAMSPASIMKLVTTYAALEALGPAYNWKTEAYSSAALTGDTLDGALILKGYGDPSLTLENFWLLLRNLRQRGVRDIRGGVVVDQSYFEPAAHEPAAFDNEPLRAYNAAPQALLVNFNAIRLRLLPQAGGEAIKVVADPSPPSLAVVSAILPDNAPCGDWREDIATDVSTTGKERALTLHGKFPVSCGEKSFNL
ncbi:MAG: D-alanyl-D-alanine carboxypeptidase/D-alanyl-D-alanine-endopeptidase, partial [Sulfurimicrobium sp.]